ncbi:MAG: hypothetical protein Q9227_004380 [Pyrenula ochraceoflavens]
MDKQSTIDSLRARMTGDGDRQALMRIYSEIQSREQELDTLVQRQIKLLNGSGNLRSPLRLLDHEAEINRTGTDLAVTNEATSSLSKCLTEEDTNVNIVPGRCVDPEAVATANENDVQQLRLELRDYRSPVNAELEDTPRSVRADEGESEQMLAVREPRLTEGCSRGDRPGTRDQHAKFNSGEEETRVKELHAENRDLAAKKEDRRVGNKDLESHETSSDAVYQDHDAQLNVLQSRVHKLENTVAGKEAAIDSQWQRIQSIQAELKAKTDEIGKCKKEFEDINDTHNEKYEKLVYDYNDLEGEKNDLQYNNGKLQARCAKLEEVIDYVGGGFLTLLHKRSTKQRKPEDFLEDVKVPQRVAKSFLSLDVVQKRLDSLPKKKKPIAPDHGLQGQGQGNPVKSGERRKRPANTNQETDLGVLGGQKTKQFTPPSYQNDERVSMAPVEISGESLLAPPSARGTDDLSDPSTPSQANSKAGRYRHGHGNTYNEEHRSKRSRTKRYSSSESPNSMFIRGEFLESIFTEDESS